ncbi:MAG TPA: YggS family pyridoxal phosphate-dependent enzyme [Planctomycetota bacterium]|nr:YggS family pyridoxal phosphate-dependent enzyme [Planctomycetota bacterium]HRR80988.1 YggS family pyridoxal phosphate-dependent enzyme [Planctomycetota bacterium]HRT93654.1 YggS family pyridoxal phosphate-dependent enzyme [Planctomycetota bacterium]
MDSSPSPQSRRLAANVTGVLARIAAACARSARAPASVTLVAVTKSVGPDIIAQLPGLGIRHIGENRVQAARDKQAALGGLLGLQWHMIGHLQSNKAGAAVRHFQKIHSLDSLHLAQELDRRAAQSRVTLPVLIQCNLSGEETKSGIAASELGRLLDGLMSLPHLRVEGLMTMAPFSDDPETSRPVFAGLRELACQARAETSLPLHELSMGMTRDFEVAIEEGATLVRVGTALFDGL